MCLRRKPPLDTLEAERRKKAEGVVTAQTETMEECTAAGQSPNRLMPTIKTWVDRRHGEVDHYINPTPDGAWMFRKVPPQV